MSDAAANPGIAGEASLELSEVSVAYGNVMAVEEVSFSVGAGETVAVVGPSGSGKSTLLRAVAGLEPLAGGDIRADGRSLRGVATHRRDLGLMFQDHALFTHLDVAANVGFGLRMKRWSVEERRTRVGELLELVGLAGFGSRGVHQLSGGEAQRVALARALAPAPGLLMLDEPFGSLDRLLREELTGEVRRLLTELGQTALHVTHDQAEAFALADRVAVLADGRLHQIGEPGELWRRPSSAFVAGFLGHTTIWSIDVDAGGRACVDGQVLAERVGWPEGTWLVVVPLDAIRPDADGVIRVTVDETVFRDGRYRVTGRLVARSCSDGTGPAATGGGLAGSGHSVTFDTRTAPSVGGVVRVSIDGDALHRFV